MHEINLVDRSFDQDAAGPCSISLQANQSGLTYCITDQTVNNYVLFRKHRFEHVYLTGDLIEKTAEGFVILRVHLWKFAEDIRQD